MYPCSHSENWWHMKCSNHMSINRNWHGMAQQWNVDYKIFKEKAELCMKQPGDTRLSLIGQYGGCHNYCSLVSSCSQWIPNILRAPFTHVTSRSSSCLCPVCLCFVHVPNGVCRHKAEMKALFMATKSEWWCKLGIYSCMMHVLRQQLTDSDSGSNEMMKQMTRD